MVNDMTATFGLFRFHLLKCTSFWRPTGGPFLLWSRARRNPTSFAHKPPSRV